MRFTSALVATLLSALSACSHTQVSGQKADSVECGPKTLTPQQIEQIALAQLGPAWRQALIAATARTTKNYWMVLMAPKESRSPGDDWFELIDFCGNHLESRPSH